MRPMRYYNVSTVTTTGTPVAIPAAGRLVAVRGANSEADSYAYSISIITTAGYNTETVSGVVNGRRVSHRQDMPFVATSTTLSPTALGELTILITPGANASLEVYYSSGASVIDAPLASESGICAEPLPNTPTGQQWLGAGTVQKPRSTYPANR